MASPARGARQSYLETLHSRYEEWLVENPTQHGGNVPVLVRAAPSRVDFLFSFFFLLLLPRFGCAYMASGLPAQILDGNRDSRTSDEVYADFADAIHQVMGG